MILESFGVVLNTFLHIRKLRPLLAIDASCDAINQHFLTIAQKTIADLPSSSVSLLSYIDRVDVPDLSLFEVQFDDVVQYIQVLAGLDVHKAVGIGAISKRCIKASPYGMAVVLTTRVF